jgi:predicted metalloendopeptidase
MALIRASKQRECLIQDLVEAGCAAQSQRMGNVAVDGQRVFQSPFQRGQLSQPDHDLGSTTDIVAQIVFPAGILQPPFFSHDW